VDVVAREPLDALPHFNPDAEEAGPPPPVLAWRSQVQGSDALVISSPEYAHGVPGVLKNALDWLVGGVEIVGKPIGAIDATWPSTIAHASLVETLRVMGGRVLEDASPAVPMRGRKLDAHGIAADPELAALLRSALAALVRAATG